MLRNVTFHENERRRHRGPTHSSRMRLPALGAGGCMRAAGVSRRVAAAAAQVAKSVMPMPSPAAASAMGQSMGMAARGT